MTPPLSKSCNAGGWFYYLIIFTTLFDRGWAGSAPE